MPPLRDEHPETLEQPHALPHVESVTLPTSGARLASADVRQSRSAHRLAMLALQSVRYSRDSEYAEAVDAVLAWSAPWKSAERLSGKPTENMPEAKNLLAAVKSQDAMPGSQQKVVSAHFVHKHKTTELHCSCGAVTEMANNNFYGRIECKNCFALREVKDRIGQQCVPDCPWCVRV